LEGLLECNIEIVILVPGGYDKLTIGKLHYTKSEYGLDVRIKKGEQAIADFKLIQLPGCCGVLVSYNSYVYFTYRNRGMGKILNEFRQEIATYLGYTVMLCTDKDSNEPQSKILKSQGFKSVHQFTNRRTDNLVNISVLDLVKDNTEG
jgi:hypothetical protein